MVVRASARLIAFCVLLAGGVRPQQVPPKSTLPPVQGLETPWDVRSLLERLKADTNDLKSLFDGLKPQQWLDQKGAPSTYILQWQTAKQQLNDVSVTSGSFAQKTESLPLALDTYFRLEALDVTARSLEEGTRKYGDRPTADRMAQVLAHNFNNRERLRDYLRDLAATAEQNFKVADEEAQRCRGMISKEPAPAAKKYRK
jgi:hypothetical protein